MARIDFAFGAPDRLRMACDVVRKHHAAGRPLLVYSQNSGRLKQFDRLLWSFEPTAFIPHVAVDDELAPVTPVLLTSTLPTPEQHPRHAESPVWLLNLDDHAPETAPQFQRILEIVDSKPAEVQNARQRWKAYKEAGHDLHAHDVSARA